MKPNKTQKLIKLQIQTVEIVENMQFEALFGPKTRLTQKPNSITFQWPNKPVPQKILKGAIFEAQNIYFHNFEGSETQFWQNIANFTGMN